MSSDAVYKKLRADTCVGSVGGSGRRGSVLMEFIIVAPLYFTLLGGLFFVGELGLNRMRMLIGDHVATWLGATRFVDSELTPIGNFLRTHLFKDTMDMDAVIEVDKPELLGWHNDFMAVYKGGIEGLEVAMPAWARGMLFMQQATTGGDMTELSAINYKYKYYNGAKDFFRSYSFHRLNNHEIGRGECSAQEIVTGGVLGRVVSDRWICGDDGNGQSNGSAATGTNSSGLPGRSLSEWAE